ncbi:MAG: hypothetical protein ACOVOX_07455 [Burkholderiaceae bacterium]
MVFAAFPVGVTLAVLFTVDGLRFHELSNGEFKTPWFAPEWWSAPYTHAALAFYEPHEYWTTNAVGTERWHVREVPVGHVTFWTIMERQSF